MTSTFFTVTTTPLSITVGLPFTTGAAETGVTRCFICDITEVEPVTIGWAFLQFEVVGPFSGEVEVGVMVTMAAGVTRGGVSLVGLTSAGVIFAGVAAA